MWGWWITESRGSCSKQPKMSKSELDRELTRTEIIITEKNKTIEKLESDNNALKSEIVSLKSALTHIHQSYDDWMMNGHDINERFAELLDMYNEE